MTGAEMDAIKEAADRKEYERRFPSEDQQKAIDAVKTAAKKFSEALNALQIAAGETEAALSPGWARVVSIFESAQDMETEIDRVLNEMEGG
jgi:predicted Zn-dependent protease